MVIRSTEWVSWPTATLWRIDTPHTATVLEALGDAHDSAVAKAACTALFKHRSQG